MRITGGKYGSRPLKAPKGSLTRPTSDRVREALFSILGPQAAAAKVLDLYAGTGALGLEALSRGAGSVVFVERSKEALVALNANVDALGVRSRVRILPHTIERGLRGLAGHERFSLVFADPPYADVPSGAAVATFETLLVPVLSADGLLVLEHASRDPSPAIEGLIRHDSRTYGDTTLAFFVVDPANSAQSSNEQ
jgi:16S rRNA (guanine966-N2)-methyltransferase